MKKLNQNPSKLSLKKESLVKLDNQHLDQAKGGVLPFLMTMAIGGGLMWLSMRKSF